MKIIIIEDENAAARRLEKMLKEIDPEILILQFLDSVEASVNWLQFNPPPDLIFMDIQLADGLSFEIFQHVQVTSPVVFTTAYDEYAIKAFKVNAVDYLLKPLKPAELEAAVTKYKKHFRINTPDYAGLMQQARPQDEPTHLRRMLIRFGHSIKLIDMADVAYFYTKDKITFMVVKNSAKRFPVDYPLDKLEDMLDKKSFFRINRQFIIHIAAIKEMQPHTKSRVRLDLDPAISDLEIVVSTERSSEFKRWLVGKDVNA